MMTMNTRVKPPESNFTGEAVTLSVACAECGHCVASAVGCVSLIFPSITALEG